MKALDQIGRECTGYFEERAKFRTDVCRDAAEELKHVFIRTALQEKYIEYVTDCLSDAEPSEASKSLMDYEVWIDDLSKRDYDKLVRIAKPGFKDAILKTVVIKKLFEEEATDQTDLEDKGEKKRSVWSVASISAGIGAGASAAVSSLPEDFINQLILFLQSLG